ncbi:MAG: hypothetical protein H0T46_23395 [Deltaproteobacteria bacterium]|nr:hypothetical protein [Deltaproteobacteria bacterium]
MTPVDAYVVATLASLDHSIAELALPEARVKDRHRASQVIERLLETLVGLAIGSSVGAVIAGVRRTMGEEVGARIPLVAQIPRANRWFDDEGPARTPAAELKLRLRGRVARCGRDVHAMIAAVEREVRADDRAAFARILGLLAGDQLTAERYARQVRAGWRCAAATIEERPVPAVEPLWQHWAVRISGEPPARTDDVFLRIA